MGTMFYPGSFDLPTLGHMHVVRMALSDPRNHGHRLVIIVGVNQRKEAEGRYMFRQDVRLRLVRLALRSIRLAHQVDVITGDPSTEAGLFARHKPVRMIRGARDAKDEAEEKPLHQHWLDSYGVPTQTYRSAPYLTGVSSTSARSLVFATTPDWEAVRDMIPKPVAQLLKDVFTTDPAARTDKEALHLTITRQLDRLEQQNGLWSGWRKVGEILQSIGWSQRFHSTTTPTTSPSKVRSAFHSRL